MAAGGDDHADHADDGNESEGEAAEEVCCSLYVKFSGRFVITCFIRRNDDFRADLKRRGGGIVWKEAESVAIRRMSQNAQFK